MHELEDFPPILRAERSYFISKNSKILKVHKETEIAGLRSAFEVAKWSTFLGGATDTRVSTKDQVKEGYSLKAQREYLKSFAKCGGKDYINRIEEFLKSYDPDKKVMDKETR